MVHWLNWQAFSAKERNIVIEEIKQTISSHEGYVVNFTMFSDLALSLTVEIEEKHVTGLHQALAGLLNISEIGTDTINPMSEKEWVVLLNISFSQGRGDMTKEVPMVPG